MVSTVSEGSEQNPFSVIGPLLFSCMAHALLVLLFFFLIKGAMEGAVKLTETKLSRMFVLGFAEFFVLPLLGLFLLFPLVTAPISALIFIFIAVLWMFSIPFAGYVLGRRLFEGMAPLGAGVIGTLVLTAVCYIPCLFFVAPTVCSIFIAGYLTQSFLDKRMEKKGQVPDSRFRFWAASNNECFRAVGLPAALFSGIQHLSLFSIYSVNWSLIQKI